MRKFIVGAYWGGLMAAAIGLLPIVILRPGFIPAEVMAELHAAVPALVLAGFALLTSVVAAGVMLVLREVAALRAAVARAMAAPAELGGRLSEWHGAVLARKPTMSCHACDRTNWTEATHCVDCGAPLATQAKGMGGTSAIGDAAGAH